MNINQNNYIHLPPEQPTDHYVKVPLPEKYSLSGRVSPTPPSSLSQEIGRFAQVTMGSQGQIGPQGQIYALAPRMTPPGTPPGTPSTPRSLSGSQESQDEAQMLGNPHHIQPTSASVRKSQQINNVAFESQAFKAIYVPIRNVENRLSPGQGVYVSSSKAILKEQTNNYQDADFPLSRANEYKNFLLPNPYQNLPATVRRPTPPGPKDICDASTNKLVKQQEYLNVVTIAYRETIRDVKALRSKVGSATKKVKAAKAEVLLAKKNLKNAPKTLQEDAKKRLKDARTERNKATIEQKKARSELDTGYNFYRKAKTEYNNAIKLCYKESINTLNIYENQCKKIAKDTKENRSNKLLFARGIDIDLDKIISFNNKNTNNLNKKINNHVLRIKNQIAQIYSSSR